MVRWRLLDRLDSAEAQTVFDRMHALYEASFPEDSERESRRTWEAALGGEAQGYRLEFFVATVGADVAGAAAFEYYAESRCGLVTFIFVAPAHRREGIARNLLERVEGRLLEVSEGTLRYVFAEAEDPERVIALGVASAIDPAVRLRILARLGARAVGVRYVQPALEPGKRPAHHLRLLMLRPRELQSVPRDDLRDFLRAFYASLLPDAETARGLVDSVLASADDDPIPLLDLA